MDTKRNTGARTPDEARIDGMFWRHWAMLVSVPVLMTLVLAALLAVVRTLLPGVWPWPGTQTMLAAGLYTMIVIFASYATIQQRRLMQLRDSRTEARLAQTDVRRRHRARLLAISNLSRAIGNENDPRQVFDTLVRLCQELFESDRVSLLVVNQTTGMMVVTASVGLPDAHRLIGVAQPMDEGIAGWVATHRKPLLVGPDHHDPEVDRRRRNFGVRSAMVVPLLVREKVAGVLCVSNDTSVVRYEDEDLTTLQVFSETAEYCIRHAENADWMRGLIRQFRTSKKTGETVAQESPVVADAGPRNTAGRDDSGYLRVESRELEPLWALTTGAHAPVNGGAPN